jgi:translation initiation factor IF-3
MYVRLCTNRLKVRPKIRKNRVRETNEKDSLRKKYLVNDQIKAVQILVITETGEQLGVMSRRDALAKAEEVGADLVKIGDQDTIAVAKLMDFGKYLYLKKKQQAESKKNQKVIQIKEVKLRPNIGDQDYMIKLNQAVRFLKEGKRVKFTLQFRGREMVMMKETGPKFFDRIDNDLEAQQLGTLISEKETRGRPLWSKVYYLKGS